MVRVGLLQCDSLDPPHVDVAGDYDELFTGILARPGVEVVVYRADAGVLPHSPTECDVWVVPGSRMSVYDEIDWILDLRRLVGRFLAAEVPLAGVCFGHQMIAQEMGAPVARSEGGWNVGAIEYALHRPAPGEGGDARPGMTLIASHQDQVLSLPDGAELLASAPTCPVAGFTVGARVLTVQGHPEFGADVAGSLYRSRVERIGAEPIAAALASLDRPLDRHRVANWIISLA